MWLPHGLAAWVAVFAWLVASAAAQPSRVVWAWERPEALDELPQEIGIASVTGFIRLRGGAIVIARGRRFPLIAAPGRATPVAVIHIEIDQNETLNWSAQMSTRVIAAAVAFAHDAPHVQLDMEVRASQHEALLDVLRGLRASMGPNTTLSMTALASWCEAETWLDQAPVDEIVPMLFRMGHGGARLRAKLAAGGDFRQARCRQAAGISIDTQVAVPAGRRLYIFNPRPWDSAAIAALGRG